MVYEVAQPTSCLPSGSPLSLLGSLVPRCFWQGRQVRLAVTGPSGQQLNPPPVVTSLLGINVKKNVNAAQQASADAIRQGAVGEVKTLFDHYKATCSGDSVWASWDQAESALLQAYLDVCSENSTGGDVLTFKDRLNKADSTNVPMFQESELDPHTKTIQGADGDIADQIISRALKLNDFCNMMREGLINDYKMPEFLVKQYTNDIILNETATVAGQWKRGDKLNLGRSITAVERENTLTNVSVFAESVLNEEASKTVSGNIMWNLMARCQQVTGIQYAMGNKVPLVE